MSPLLARLEREFASSVDPIAAAEISCRIACEYARAGRFQHARDLIQALRQTYGDGRSGRVTVWIMLAEGLTKHYEELSPYALDRIGRAQLLSVALKYPTVIALASAWKGHIEFEDRQFASMSRSLLLAMQHALPEEHDAQTRLSMVLSNAFMFSGDSATAQRMFKRGHRHAVANGDQTSIEALLYNRIAFAVTAARVDSALGKDMSSFAANARSEVASSHNLQQLTGIQALTNHLPLWRARLAALDLRFDEAIADLESTRTLSPYADHNYSAQLIDLEICYCRAVGGSIDAALETFKGLGALDLSKLDMDDQLVGEQMKLALCKLDGRFGDYAGQQAKFDQARVGYDRWQDELKSSLSSLMSESDAREWFARP